MARDAGEIASDLKSLENELEELKDEYENCRSYPDLYDLMQDDCRTKREEYKDKVREHNGRLRGLRSQLGDFVSRTKSALSECGY